MIKLKSIIQEILNEWHNSAKLEAHCEWDENFELWSFLFYRNGRLAGQIRSISPDDGYIIGFGVQRSLQGTGIGKAMLNYVFEKTNLPFVTLHSSANQFYHKIGGDRKGSQFIIRREKIKPSSIKFQDIDKNKSDGYYNNPNQSFDNYPSIN